MNWIDPKIKQPKNEQICLIILEVEDIYYIAIAKACYPLKYHEIKKSYVYVYRNMKWNSLYNQQRTQAISINKKRVIEYKIPTELPIKEALAYIPITDGSIFESVRSYIDNKSVDKI